MTEESVEGEPRENFTSERSRLAAQITLARVENYRDLWAETEQEGDRKFLAKTRELWQEFAVHGIWGVDKKTGEQMILNYTDLDGRGCLGLLELAGIKTEKIHYIAASTQMEGVIHLDVGDRFGLVLEDEGRTVFFDHHGEKTDKKTSVTEILYEHLTALGLLKKEDYLDRMVKFISQVDNHTYPQDRDSFNNSWRTLYGLNRYLIFKHLHNYFKVGRKPDENLSTEDLEKMGLKKGSERQKDIIEQSHDRLREMWQIEGLVVPSQRYGFLAVDIDSTVPAGAIAARAFGCGGYIIWSPKENSFFISTNEPLGDELSREPKIQGFRVRENMWIKPRHDSQPLTTKLGEILERMTDGKLSPKGKLAEFLKSEK